MKAMAVLGLAVGLVSGCPDHVTRSAAAGSVASQGTSTEPGSLRPTTGPTSLASPGCSPSAAPSSTPGSALAGSLQVTLDGSILPTPAGAAGPEATP